MSNPSRHLGSPRTRRDNATTTTHHATEHTTPCTTLTYKAQTRRLVSSHIVNTRGRAPPDQNTEGAAHTHTPTRHASIEAPHMRRTQRVKFVADRSRRASSRNVASSQLLFRLFPLDPFSDALQGVLPRVLAHLGTALEPEDVWRSNASLWVVALDSEAGAQGRL